MAQHGALIGSTLLVFVTIWTLLLARKAASSVRQFREEQHDSFVGREAR